MPTFPPLPLKFRTVGFPQSGFKASMSGGAFPAMSPEQCTEFGPLVIGRLNLPCNAVYVTDKLLQSLLGRYEV
jgi:hypothetical protein